MTSEAKKRGGFEVVYRTSHDERGWWASAQLEDEEEMFEGPFATQEEARELNRKSYEEIQRISRSHGAVATRKLVN